MTTAARNLQKIYRKLLASFGPQHWWPGETQFEVIVGAILTQNTNWGNVERAIKNLKAARALSPKALDAISARRLARLIRPTGYFNVKARRLKSFMKFFRKNFGLSVRRMFETPTASLRDMLLAVNGIGPETADSILLYAGGRRVFVVDAYTKRVFSRHGFFKHDAEYEDVRRFFERNFAGRAPEYNEFHALIVRLGKDFCRPKNPRCGECPMGFLKRALHCFNGSSGPEERSFQ